MINCWHITASSWPQRPSSWSFWKLFYVQFFRCSVLIFLYLLYCCYGFAVWASNMYCCYICYRCYTSLFYDYDMFKLKKATMKEHQRKLKKWILFPTVRTSWKNENMLKNVIFSMMKFLKVYLIWPRSFWCIL